MSSTPASSTAAHALERAINACHKPGSNHGGQSFLARELSRLTGKRIRQGHIWSWLKRQGRVPPEFAPYIEAIAAARGTLVTRDELCPDFPWGVVPLIAKAPATPPPTAAAI